MTPAERDARIRELKRSIPAATAELIEARRTAPKTWTGKCARAAKSFGAYDRGERRIATARYALEGIHQELAELRHQVRNHHRHAEMRKAWNRAQPRQSFSSVFELPAAA
jgi:hypothetical protein